MKHKNNWHNIPGLVQNGAVILPELRLNQIFHPSPSDSIRPHELLRKIRGGLISPPRQNVPLTQEEILLIGHLLDSGLGISEVSLITQQDEAFIGEICTAGYYRHTEPEMAVEFPENNCIPDSPNNHNHTNGGKNNE